MRLFKNAAKCITLTEIN